MSNAPRTIRLFSLHAHDSESAINYLELFHKIQQIPKHRRTKRIAADLNLHLDTVSIDGNEVSFAVAGGSPDEVPMLIDSSTGDMAPAQLPPENWIGQVSQVVIHVTDEARVCAIENRRNGVTPKNLAKLLTELHQDAYQRDVDLYFSAIADMGFIEKVKEMDRIRQVTVEMTRPNPDWTDHYSELAQIADVSNAQKASTTVTAGRGQSLSKSQGIVPLVQEEATGASAHYDKLVVLGTIPGEEGEVKADLQHSIRQGRVHVPVGLSPWQVAERVRDECRSLISQILPNAKV